MGKRWRCRSRQTFFGLTAKYMENVYEQFFAMMYYGRWDFQQAYSLPVGLRKWFMERLIKEKEKEKEQIEKAREGQ